MALLREKNHVSITQREKPCLIYYKWVNSYIFKKIYLWKKNRTLNGLLKVLQDADWAEKKRYYFAKIME